ncbi:MAG: CBS domain-containing protein [Planctomycetes bacterium]|nr:CBS domain-containing protein [Planctomycetota bacterium]
MVKSIQKIVHQLLGYRRLSADTYLLVLSVVIGILGGYGAVLFRYLIAFFQYLALGQGGNEVVSLLMTKSWLHKLIVPVIGGAIVAPMIYFLAREAKGHGVPEVMEAIAMHNGIIRPRVVLVKSVASALTIGTGGSVGREGPIVQIGAAFASSLGQLVGVTGERLRVLVACGVTAGITATFNAPIAGVFFSVEIILGNYAITTLSPLIISSVAATVVSRAYLGDVPAFAIPRHLMISPWETLFYALLGMLAGVVAFLFTKLLYATEDIFDAIKVPEYTKGIAGGALVGVGLLYFPQIYGVGYDTITKVLKGEELLWVLLVLVGVKMLAMSITIGSGGSGGIFAPSLLVGACLGGAFGIVVGKIFPGIVAPSGAYAVAGMGAVVAGTTRGPITAILIIFEMTGDYKIILPIMMAAIISSLVASKLSRESMYTLKLARRGIHLDEGMEVCIMKGARVENVMEPDASTLPPEAPFSEVLKKILQTHSAHHYVVDGERHLIGVISLHDVKSVLHRSNLDPIVIAEDMADTSMPTVSPDSTLADALDLLLGRNTEELPVLDGEGKGVFLGVVSKRTILDFYQREILKEEAQGLKFIRREDRAPGTDYTGMGFDRKMKELRASPKMVGKTLVDLHLRETFNVNVVSIRSAKPADADTAPDPNRAIEADDVLVVIGQPEDIEKMKTDLEISD